MGVLRFSRIFKPFTSDYTLTHLDDSVIYNVVVDGTLVLFKGLADRTQAHDEFNISRDAKQYLDSIIRSFNFRIGSVKVYIDGISPTMKTRTSKNRIRVFDVKKATGYFVDLCKTSGMEVIELMYGESEMQMLLERDPNTPTVAITNDSDVYTLCYGKKWKHPVYLHNRYNFINLTSFSIEDMHRNIFVSLILLTGTDYTQSLFTESMSLAIIKCYENRNQYNMYEYFDAIQESNMFTEIGWHCILNSYYNIFMIAKKANRFRLYFGKRGSPLAKINDTKLTKDEQKLLDTLVFTLAWTCRYYEYGKSVDCYINNEDGYPHVPESKMWHLMKNSKPKQWRDECINVTAPPQPSASLSIKVMS